MLYLAISYVCNQRCSFCPCGTLKNQRKFLSLSDVRAFLENHIENYDRHVVISGGEPTLHPDFVEILCLFQRSRFKITVLSTSERFSDSEFAHQVFSRLDPAGIKVITTLHSHDEAEHEEVNQTQGSFRRSMQGLINARTHGCEAVVKHCITRKNYQDLSKFYHFVDFTFEATVDMQYCSIDYCGVNEGDREKEFVSFSMMKESVEDMLDCYFTDRHKGSLRKLYCINLPLCTVEPLYWSVFQKKTAYYDAHLSPDVDGMLRVNNHASDTVSTSDICCEGCLVRNMCVGTYQSAFDIYGNQMVMPYK